MTDSLARLDESANALALVQIEAAWRALEAVETVQDAVTVTRGAEALRVFVKQARLGLRLQNEAAMVKVEATAKAGEMLDARPPHPPGPPGRDELDRLTQLPPSLEDLGISRFESHYWQKVASVPALERQAFYALVGRNVDLAEVAGPDDPKPEPQEVTTAGTLRYHQMAVHRSSEEDEWLTPPEIITRTVAVLGAIDLDPCANSFGPPNVPAETRYTAEDDGLAQPWHGRVYMNPPYGAAIRAWVAKLAEAYAAGHVSAAVALVPARTDTDWWADLSSTTICLIHGRLRFSGSANSAPFPSAVAYFGPRRDAFAAAFGSLGDIWVRLEA